MCEATSAPSSPLSAEGTTGVFFLYFSKIMDKVFSRGRTLSIILKAASFEGGAVPSADSVLERAVVPCRLWCLASADA